MSIWKGILWAVFLLWLAHWLYMRWAWSKGKKLRGRRLRVRGFSDADEFFVALGAVIVEDEKDAEFDIRIEFPEVYCRDVSGNHGAEKVMMQDPLRPNQREIGTLVIYVGHFIERSDLWCKRGWKNKSIPLG